MDQKIRTTQTVIKKKNHKVALHNKQGQSLIETLLVIPTLLTLLSSILILAYWIFLSFFLNYMLEEAMLCLTTYKANSCQTSYRQKVISKLLFCHLEKWSLLKTSKSIEGYASIDFIGNQKLNFRRQLLLKKGTLPYDE